MSRGSVLVLAYSNGKMFQGEEGVMFDGRNRSMFEISSLATFEVLKQKIHSKLNLMANQEVSKVTYRFPISANKYKSVQLKSDDDVRCMFRCHAKHSDLNAIELFIEVNTRQTRLSQTDVGYYRSRSQPTRMATSGNTSRRSKAMPVLVSAYGSNMFQGAGNQVLKYRSVLLKNDNGVDCMFDGHLQQHPSLGGIESYVVEKVEMHRFVEAQSPLRDGSNKGLHSAERSSTRQMKGVLGGSLAERSGTRQMKGVLGGGSLAERSSTRQMKGRGS